ncbi:MAG: M24 family metallopeptidase [Elusimicrobiota bacterium]
MSGKRLKRITDWLESISVDAAVIYNPADIFYLTGARGPSLLLISGDKIYCYVSQVVAEEVKNKLDGINCITYRFGLPWKNIFKILKDCKVAVDKNNISFNQFRKIKELSKDIILKKDIVSRYRVVKDAGEIEKIKTAAQKMNVIMETLDTDICRGSTEIELTGWLTSKMWQENFTGPSFTPVVAAGKNSACPHHLPDATKINRGWLKIDAGLKYKGYCSDLTRTFILDKLWKDFNSEDLFDKLSKAKKAAVEKLKPGIECAEIYNTAMDVLKSFKMGRWFNHGLGHGVGIEVHERPYLKPSGDEILKEGMVLTVEPGIYIPGAGGMRLEDMYLITRGGSQLLSGKYR